MHAEQTGRVGFRGDFRVGEWLVQPSLDRLTRNGVVLRVRPQLVDLLFVLAQHGGRTVPKDRILALVWETQHVAESGLTRCIAELRQALDDDAHEPRVIQTIPKRGYRLVAPVEFLDTAGGPASGALDDPGGGTAIVQSPVPAGPCANAGLAAAPDPTRPRRAGRSRRTGVTVGALLGTAFVLALTWGASGWSLAPVLSSRDTVLLADVSNTTGDPAFDGTLRLALAVQLGQAPFLNILSDDHVRKAVALSGRPATQAVTGPVALEICRREGAAVLLAGSIARLGSHYAVGIEALACRTGDGIGRELVEADGKEQVLTALGTAAARLRERLGESRASLQQFDVPIVRATTPSLEALRALSLGDLNRDHARMADALTYYRHATDLDPQFALAWARRGAAARNAALSVGESRSGPADEPAVSFRKAYELRDRVSEAERYYILAHYYRFVENDPDKALETYQTWQRTYPGSAVPPTNLASLYINTFGRYDAGLEQAREAVRLAPYSSLAHCRLVAAYMGLNRMPDARQALREAERSGAADLPWRGLAFQLAFADTDASGMMAHVRWASGNVAAGLLFAEYRALAAASTGRLREARRLWSEAAGAAAQVAGAARQAGVRLNEAEAEALLGDTRRARAAAEAALVLDRQPGTVLSAGIVFALAGDLARARTLINDAGRWTDPGLRSKFVWVPVGRALVEAASGRSAQAIELLRAASRFEGGRDFGLAPLGVRAMVELSAGHPANAASAFEELLRLRAAVPTSPWVAFARLGLARARRDAGHAQASRAAYDATLDALGQADTDAPQLVAARAERAALGIR